jgi:DNA polymerase IIIc chi subunit
VICPVAETPSNLRVSASFYAIEVRDRDQKMMGMAEFKTNIATDDRRGVFVVVVTVSLLATPTMSLWRAHEEQYIPHGIQGSVPSFRSRVTAWKPSRSPWNVNKCLAKYR